MIPKVILFQYISSRWKKLFLPGGRNYFFQMEETISTRWKKLFLPDGKKYFFQMEETMEET